MKNKLIRVFAGDNDDRSSKIPAGQPEDDLVDLLLGVATIRVKKMFY